MEESVFTKIIRREIPATFIYEDDMCIGMLDISPLNFGHTLVIPKKQYENIYEIPDDLLGHLFSVAKKIAKALKEGLGAEGVNIIMNNEAAAGQVVFHAHIHVIPRYEGDGYEHWHGKETYTDEKKQEVAEKIKSALK